MYNWRSDSKPFDYATFAPFQPPQFILAIIKLMQTA